MKKQEPKHWFLLSYLVQQPGLWTPTSIVVGADTMNISIPQLNGYKQAHRVPEASVMIAVSYLGFQTEKAINGLPDIDPPTIASREYDEGVIAAVKISPHDSRQPLNPYANGDMDPYTVAKAEEWMRGFDATRRAQAADGSGIKQVPLPEQQAVVGERAEPVTSTRKKP
ncbi:MAG: hypothetical protein DI616_16030 [Paracoccus denitrificans]|uniref:Uncharacterized protein n=1 Tax=Paracoccus denitrificans TaxID=266 RepID=A0A533I2F0_PARDE|nr:MAG: hypothetical protein DI616_16030 [Paracoccus denitrificans]